MRAQHLQILVFRRQYLAALQIESVEAVQGVQEEVVVVAAVQVALAADFEQQPLAWLFWLFSEWLLGRHSGSGPSKYCAAALQTAE